MDISETGTAPILAQNLTVEELATELRTTPKTIHYWIRTSKAPRSFKVGKRRLFARADIDTWLEAAKDAS